MPSVRCSVILLASDDAPGVLESLASALDQDLDDHEVLVVGDGLAPSTRAALAAATAQDDRVRLLDRPAAAGAGEAHLVGALALAGGHDIAYLRAGDLWTPDHLRVVTGMLADGAHLAHTLAVHVGPGRHWVDGVDLGRPEDRLAVLAGRPAPTLSCLAHTAVAYAGLDLGWRALPEQAPGADLARQLLAARAVVAAGTTRPTAMVWDRPPVADADAEAVARWRRSLQDPAWRAESLPVLALDATMVSWRATEDRLQAIVGSPPWVAVDRVVTKARRVARRLRGRARG